MATLTYRSDLVQKLFDLIEADSTFQAKFPAMRRIKENATGKTKRMVLRAPADFPMIRVGIGTNHSGTLWGVKTFADEQAGYGGAGEPVERSAEIVVEFFHDMQTEESVRDELEMHLLDLVMDQGGRIIPGCSGSTFRHTTGEGKSPDGQTAAWASRIVFTFNFIFGRSQVTA